MLSEEVIERLKAKIPAIKGDHKIYGITQLDIQCADGEVKQIGKWIRFEEYFSNLKNIFRAWRIFFVPSSQIERR